MAVRFIAWAFIASRFSTWAFAGDTTYVVGGWLPQSGQEITNSLAPIFQDYLTEQVGKSLSPPAKFVFRPVDMDESTTSREMIMSGNLDLLYSAPGSIACKAAEFGWVPLATQRNIVGSSVTGSDALVVYSLLKNTAITSVEDLVGKRLGCGYLLSGTTYLHGYQMLLDHGVHIFRDMTQVRFYGSDYESNFQAVLRGELDVGFATSSWLSKNHNDEIGLLRIHDRQIAPSYEREGYPSVVSRLTPTYGVVVSDNLSWELKRKIQEALLSHNASHPAMRSMNIAGWSSAANYGVSLTAAVNSGVAYETGKAQITCRNPFSRRDIWESISCPSDYFKADYNLTTEQCDGNGLRCPSGVFCFCKPCIRKPQNLFRWETVLGLCVALYAAGGFYILLHWFVDRPAGHHHWHVGGGGWHSHEASSAAETIGDGGDVPRLMPRNKM